MSKKRFLVALDDGHGSETPGKRTPHITEIGRAIKENEFNKAVVNILATELKRCGFDVLLVAPTDKDDSLETRVKRANVAGADIYVSVHYDAFDGKFDGYDPEGITVFYAKGSTNGKKLAECIHAYLKTGTVQKDRGIKTAVYYVLTKTNMPAILTENGFMDNKREALLMIDKEFQQEVAREHAQGICKYFGIPYVSVNTTQHVASKGYSSPTLQKKTMLALSKKAEQKKIVENAIAAGASVTWRTKLAKGAITDDDFKGLAILAAVK